MIRQRVKNTIVSPTRHPSDRARPPGPKSVNQPGRRPAGSVPWARGRANSTCRPESGLCAREPPSS